MVLTIIAFSQTFVNFILLNIKGINKKVIAQDFYYNSKYDYWSITKASQWMR